MNWVYLDANCVICLVEGASPFHDKVVARLSHYRDDPGASLLTSRLTRLECRVRPLRDGNLSVLAAYDGFFSASRLALGELTAAVIERATELRARYWFSTPDAIHLATAIEGRADVVLTGDAALRRCREVTVEVLEP